MNEHFEELILRATGARDLFVMHKMQDLWSGYGVIMRYGLKGSSRETVVVKHVHWPQDDDHPRGWNTDRGHARKVRSYEVETAWYSRWSARCDASCSVPACLAYAAHAGEVLMVLEDLNSSGYSERRRTVSLSEIKACLAWLASFHATFLGESPEGLWPIGTYWHLATRPDELAVLDDRALRDAAPLIDQKLNESRFLTFVHGDAKLANFCFAPDGKRVAAVDFQYVGGGCGMKDVAYFLGSCLYDDACEEHERALLAAYFSYLKKAVRAKKPAIDCASLEAEWRALYPVAWTDFHRFIKGWSPGHWKITSYSERVARQVLEAL